MKHLVLMKKEITVGVALFDDEGRILLIRRKYPPAAGLWTLPMGHVEVGESLQDAALREVGEETNLVINIDSVLGKFKYKNVELTIYLGKIVEGSLIAGDDAGDAKFINMDDLPLNSPEKTINPPADYWAYEMHNEILHRITTLMNSYKSGDKNNG